MKVFTLGYQGLELDKYVSTLQSFGVGVVVDVRERAWSYNRRYTKGVMSSTLAESGIRYSHLRECGNPSANRKTATSAQECLDRYRDYLSENLDCLQVLVDEISDADAVGAPACLTCFEQEPADCHRAILLDFLLDRHPDLDVQHIVVDPSELPRIVGLNPVSDTTAQLL